MTYRGRVQNGVVVPEPGAELPEGAEVRIDVKILEQPKGADDNATESSTAASTRFDRYKKVIGVIKGLPPDASERVDEILYDLSDQ